MRVVQSRTWRRGGAVCVHKQRGICPALPLLKRERLLSRRTGRDRRSTCSHHGAMANVPMRRLGLTLLEVLVVVAVFGVVATGLTAASRPRAAHDHARALSHAIAAQRWRAVQENQVVVIRASDRGDVVVTSRGWFTCDLLDDAHVLLERRQGVILDWPSAALAFTTDGRARRCDGGGAGNATIDVVDRQGNRAAVIVAALGRVRWERR